MCCVGVSGIHASTQLVLVPPLTEVSPLNMVTCLKYATE